MSTKRKRTVDEPSAPFITFVVKRGDREIAFDRVLEGLYQTLGFKRMEAYYSRSYKLDGTQNCCGRKASPP